MGMSLECSKNSDNTRVTENRVKLDVGRMRGCKARKAQRGEILWSFIDCNMKFQLCCEKPLLGFEEETDMI